MSLGKLPEAVQTWRDCSHRGGGAAGNRSAFCLRKMEVHTLAYVAAVALSGLAALRPLVVYETIKQAASISSWQFRVIAFLLGTSVFLLLSVVQKEGAGHGHDEHLNHR